MVRRSTMVVAALAALLPATAAMSAVTEADREQAACYGDVQALCSDAIPDVNKVTACMLGKRAQVSAGCLRYFPPEKPTG